MAIHARPEARHDPPHGRILYQGPAWLAPAPAAHAVAVTGATGGSGTTVTCLLLAHSLARMGLRVTLVDASARADTTRTLGAAATKGLGWADIDTSGTGFNGERLRDALPLWHGVRILSSAPGDAVPEPLPWRLPDVVDSLRQASDCLVVDAAAGCRLPEQMTHLLHVEDTTRAVLAAQSLTRARPPDGVVLCRTRMEVSVGGVESALAAPCLGQYERDRRLARVLRCGEDPGRGAASLRHSPGHCAHSLWAALTGADARESS